MAALCCTQQTLLHFKLEFNSLFFKQTFGEVQGVQEVLGDL
jgi:hypothetical protein